MSKKYKYLVNTAGKKVRVSLSTYEYLRGSRSLGISESKVSEGLLGRSNTFNLYANFNR